MGCGKLAILPGRKEVFCRVCGSPVQEQARFCMKCGCNPLNGNSFCQECGTTTTERQEVCVKCGVMLKSVERNKRNQEYIYPDPEEDVFLDLDFSTLSPYYQREFTKIYNSNEKYKGKFNICAFLFGGIWALTKGLLLPAVVAIGSGFLSFGIIAIIYWFIFGFRGNYMYYNLYVKNKNLLF